MMINHHLKSQRRNLTTNLDSQLLNRQIRNYLRHQVLWHRQIEIIVYTHLFNNLSQFLNLLIMKIIKPLIHYSRESLIQLPRQAHLYRLDGHILKTYNFHKAYSCCITSTMWLFQNQEMCNLLERFTKDVHSNA